MLAKRFNQKGKVVILSETTDEPISLAGSMAGICWNSDTKDNEKNFNRGLECLRADHGKTLEYAQVYMVLDGWSARVIRELYTHNSGLPTRLQSSTRYIGYDNFEYVVPPSIENSPTALCTYSNTMRIICNARQMLEENCGISREDTAMLLPLGMTTKVVYRTNLRALIDMAKTRKCSRAYWEFRDFFAALEEALCIYSDEWKILIEEEKIFKSKCEILGYCNEKKGCGRKGPKVKKVIKKIKVRKKDNE